MKKLVTDKKKTVILASFAAVILIAFLIIGIRTHSAKDTVRGVISIDDTETDIIDSLFLVNGDKYMVDLDALNRLSFEVFRQENSCIVRNDKHQFEIYYGERTFKKDLTEFPDDEHYKMPVELDSHIYIDTDYLFDTFGYETDYLVSKDKSTVKLYLSKDTDSGELYGDIKLVDPDADIVPETVRETEVEEKYLIEEDDLQRPGEELTTVPAPTEPALEEPEAEESNEESEGETESSNKAESESGSEISINKPETIPETKAPVIKKTPITEDGRVDRTPDRPKRKTDAEFKALWSGEKTSLSRAFSGGTPSSGNVALQVRNENMIVFNPMRGGIYYDTINVAHDNTDGTFITAEFCSDWSDMAADSIIEGSKAYYNSIPGVYRNTLNVLLGNEEGTALFNYIKETADKTVKGGYVYSFDANGNLKNEWQDDFISGDGIKASEIDFSMWQDKTTADGLRYSVFRKGEGFRIDIFYD